MREFVREFTLNVFTGLGVATVVGVIPLGIGLTAAKLALFNTPRFLTFSNASPKNPHNLNTL